MNTSVNLYYSINNEIENISVNSGISKSKLVIMLIGKIKNFNSMDELNSALIEYQARIEKDEEDGVKCSAYDRVHYAPQKDLVDYTKLLRYKYRISLSKLVCASFLFFWQDILKEIFGDKKEIEKELNNYEEIIDHLSVMKKYFVKRLNIKQIEELQRE